MGFFMDSPKWRFWAAKGFYLSCMQAWSPEALPRVTAACKFGAPPYLEPWCPCKFRFHASVGLQFRLLVGARDVRRSPPRNFFGILKRNPALPANRPLIYSSRQIWKC